MLKMSYGPCSSSTVRCWAISCFCSRQCQELLPAQLVMELFESVSNCGCLITSCCDTCPAYLWIGEISDGYGDLHLSDLPYCSFGQTISCVVLVLYYNSSGVQSDSSPSFLLNAVLLLHQHNLACFPD